MLDSLNVSRFTVFEDLEFKFSRGLNIFMGENGTGKTHLLKLAYSLAWISSHAHKDPQRQTKQYLQKRIGEKLTNIFKPDSLGRLVQRKPGRHRASVSVRFSRGKGAEFGLSFASNSKSEVFLESPPERFIVREPIYLPPREVISLFPGFRALYRNREIEFDETYYDLCGALEANPLRGTRLAEQRPLIDSIEAMINGKVVNEGGRFYLRLPGSGKMEMHLVAEGWRKIAMLLYLMTNGSLQTKSMLFWDEPEANLNPLMVRELATTLVEASRQGIQVFAATHSLFFMKEIEILAKQRSLPVRYFGFSRAKTASAAVLERGEMLDDIGTISSLDAELAQSDRFQSYLEEADALN